MDNNYHLELDELFLNRFFTIDELVTMCLSEPFPGTEKWAPDNPIWDSYLPGRPSPKSAWEDADCLRLAADNMYWILNKSIANNKYPEFVESHIKALEEAMKGNNIPLLRKILIRFTIAKIAPKVTALSESTWLHVIEESGINLHDYPGVYCPMAGFGGIIRGAKKWYKENGYGELSDSMVESYDINKSFVDYFHFTGVRDMLKQKIKTDKVVIVCPPFGKEYEHWSDKSKGGCSQDTLDKMADITYIDWHRLVHEHIEAPAYIIMGPELPDHQKNFSKNGVKFNGLFNKRVGVQLWTDELCEEISKMSVEDRRKKLGLKF